MKNQQFYVKTARLAVPIMMQNMITIGVNMADNIMVGSLGENALSAVALANQFINIYQFSCMGLGQGASIMTSRFWGMKNEKALKQTIAITTRICLVLGILFTVITWCFPEIIMKIFISEPAVISDAWWNDSVASWNYTGKCDHFEVQLFRNGDLVQTETTIASEFDFIEALTDEGDYTFQVRPVIQDQTSEWTTTSNTYLSRPGQPTHIHADGHRASIAPLDDKTPGVSTGMWVSSLDDNGSTQWQYIHADGCYATDTWDYIDCSWYFFNEEGYRQTGWVTWNDHAYYCDKDGKMVTGYYDLDGGRCRFATDGRLLYKVTK